MTAFPEGNAIVYCEGAFNTPNGKTAHGLVRRTRRYRVLAVVDSKHAGSDAGEVLDGKSKDIPVLPDLSEAIDASRQTHGGATHFVVGLAPDGGRLSAEARAAVRQAIVAGLDVDCGLHDFVSEDAELAALAVDHGVTLRDVRKTPPRSELHAFTGVIEEVQSLKIALLGTDSAVGKRTTAWLLVDAFQHAGHSAELIGTGQTAWLQGAEYCLILDSLINDFVAGEIEHAVHRAWVEKRPDAIVVEGQGSLMNPAYPGGFEILAAARPDAIVLQHAPARLEYDGFPGYRLHPLETQIRALELLSDKPVVAVTVNHEGIPAAEVAGVCERMSRETGLPTIDVLIDGADGLASVFERWLGERKRDRQETERDTAAGRSSDSTSITVPRAGANGGS